VERRWVDPVLLVYPSWSLRSVLANEKYPAGSEVIVVPTRHDADYGSSPVESRGGGPTRISIGYTAWSLRSIATLSERPSQLGPLRSWWCTRLV
jgi:hypothetical protein